MLVIVGVATLPGVTAADPTFEVGGSVGLHAFSETNELGVPDIMNAPSERNSGLFGIRLGAVFNDRIGLEGEAAILPTISRVSAFDVINLSYRVHAIVQHPVTARLAPFGVVGIGAFHVASTGAEDTISTDTDAAFYVGAGIKYRLPSAWGVRGDARLLFPPSSVDDGLTTDVEVVLSLYKELGRKEPPKPVVVKPPVVVDLDPDKDGVLDPADKCPREPEDKDAFEDDDGCPDPDNDKDGLPDATDKCVNIAEDKDGFEDTDGCPDPDNDGDGISDANDKCVDQAETVNAYEDEDGCPDTVPVRIKQFTGAIEGITFKTSSAQILVTSNVRLDAAVAVLAEFPTLKIEIQGHTDDQKLLPGSPFADNVALSQARADAVRDYFVKKGIAAERVVAKGFGDSKPVAEIKGLRGRALETARSRNRRVEFQPF